MKSPTVVAIGKTGDLIILDKGNGRILFTDILGELTKDPINLGVFVPVDMTVNQNDNIILISRHLIKVLGRDGQLDVQFLPIMKINKDMPNLTGVASNSDLCIFVCDSQNKEVQCFKKDGVFIRLIRLDDSFLSPQRLAFIDKTTMVISDIVNSNVKLIDISNEQFMKPQLLGEYGVCPGEFNEPKSISVDADNNVLIADSGNHRIQVFDTHNQVCATFGRLGSRQGCLDRPCSVAVHPIGFVIVADTKNDRIVVFS